MTVKMLVGGAGVSRFQRSAPSYRSSAHAAEDCLSQPQSARAGGDEGLLAWGDSAAAHAGHCHAGVCAFRLALSVAELTPQEASPRRASSGQDRQVEAGDAAHELKEVSCPG